jgi:hypothetical protein
MNRAELEVRLNNTKIRRKHTFTITKIIRRILFREIITVYSEKHTKCINRLYGRNAEFFLVVRSMAYLVRVRALRQERANISGS